MKVLLKTQVIVLIGLLLTAGNAIAIPWLDVEGYVDPYSAAILDNGDGTSLLTGLEYTFNVIDTSDSLTGMDYVELNFEYDVFTNPTAYSYDPSSWGTPTPSTYDAGTSLRLMSLGGATIGAGDSLSFMVDVTIATAALTDSSYWDEGQVWGQAWVAESNNFFINPSTGRMQYPSDGGSTAPVPEPATMLLFGTGLVGLAGAKFRKKKM